MIHADIGTLLFVVAVSLAVAVFYHLHITRKWQQAAARLGLTYLPHDPDTRMRIWTAHLSYLSAIRGAFSHILQGTFDGRPVLVAQYTWGQGKHSVSQTVACFALQRDMPPFVLNPEGLGDKIAAAFGGQDIDFDDDQDFSSRFVLKGEEPRVRPFFNPMLRRRLLDAEGWTLVGQGRELVVLKKARVISADNLEEFVRDTRRVADLFS